MKTILVTGASGSIGTAICQNLADTGYTVIGTYNTANQQTRTNLRGYSPLITLFNVDLSKSQDVLRFVQQISTVSLFGIVNCAGLYIPETLDSVLQTWDRVIAVNLTAPMILSTQLRDALQKNGTIINIASVWGSTYGGKEAFSYAASKAGLISLTKTLAYMYRKKKIRVNAVAPSAILTSLSQKNNATTMKKLKNKTLLKRLGLPLEIANVVAFLVSNKSSYINGATITVDGGTTSWT